MLTVCFLLVFKTNYSLSVTGVISYHKSDPNFADKIRHIRDLKTRRVSYGSITERRQSANLMNRRKKVQTPKMKSRSVATVDAGTYSHKSEKRAKAFLQCKKTKDDDNVGALFCQSASFSDPVTGDQVPA